MARTRISISLEPEQAERIRRHAERAGMDVSAYLVHAATRQMAETEAIEEQFAGVDAVIAAAETEAARAGELPEEPVADLTEEERRDVERALGLVYGADRPAARPGEAA
ncbi:plasmid mobilization protein [Streptomyces fragilis]|uniref:Ribbon-helix-helix protein, CopG family n=1 Tax=Streptomyces fragilis TaxID=67301 RepID=A0ABV2YMK0_9ACTN|nr:ribbon-helix-helix protein, CopG family [Streptomyces fragilis]